MTLSGFSKNDFEAVIDGKRTTLFVLKNKNGLEMCVTNMGAVVVSLMVPDNKGNMIDVVLGFNNVQEYHSKSDSYLGALIGRFGNRIKGGEFVIDGVKHRVTLNSPHYCLHGGKVGFNSVVWDATQPNDNTVVLTHLSLDGTEGFPGDVMVKVTYTLTDENEFITQYEAITNKPTVLNLTQHSFFNLNGEGEGDVLDHIVTINSNFFTPNDVNSCPTGEIWKVANTPMDFNTPTALGDRIDDNYEQLVIGVGYDHNYILNKAEQGALSFAANTLAPKTGITMDVYTTEPAVQLYTGNWLGYPGKRGKEYVKRGAVCFEAQHFPCSPNIPHFPTTTLRPGEVYTQTCIYKFGVSK